MPHIIDKLLRRNGNHDLEGEELSEELRTKSEEFMKSLKRPLNEMHVRAEAATMPVESSESAEEWEWRRPKAVYDADCSVCSAIKHWAEPRLRYPVDFIASNDQMLECVVPNVDVDRLKAKFAFQESDGKVYYGGEASARLLARLNNPWQLIGRLGLVPPFRQLSEPMYTALSKNRPKISKAAHKVGKDLEADR